MNQKLIDLTRQISLKTNDEAPGGLLGGMYGYGIKYENDVFMMHPFCWCDKDDCGWCGEIGNMPKIIRDTFNKKYNESERLPNFYFKPTGFKMWWYKYIGRGEEAKGLLPKDWYEQCLKSLWGKEECWYDFQRVDDVVSYHYKVCLNFNTDDKNAYVEFDSSDLIENAIYGMTLEEIFKDASMFEADILPEVRKAIRLNKKYQKLSKIISNDALLYHEDKMKWHKEKFDKLNKENEKIKNSI